MSSVARQHAEWLSLLEVSGPFLSMPVLLRAFPQELEPHSPELSRTLRLAYEEWADNQSGLHSDPAIHTQWMRFVLENLLEIPKEALAQGPELAPNLTLTLPEQGETLRPDLALRDLEEPRPRLLIQYYPAAQDLDKPVNGKPWKANPATRMVELLRAANVRLGLVTNGERWMLVDAPRHETSAFASWYAPLWLEEPLTLRAFRSLLGMKRFFNVPENETLEAMFKESASNQQEVTDQLGYQVRRAVEMLVQSLDRVDKDLGRTLLAGLPETKLYEAALTVMMRLVFLLSAEERGLLLLGNELYDEHYAASTLQAQLRAQADQSGEEVLERRHDAWSRLLALFRLVYAGSDHPDLPLPAYGGHLFNPDAYPFLEGRPGGTKWHETEARPLPVNNRVVLHLLDALQLLQVRVPGGQSEARRLSFRALDVEQIGHVYEGLLDHNAFRATEPMLGLTGPRDQEPEVTLAKLEALAAKGEAALLDFLKEETGRSLNALKKDLAFVPDLYAQGRLRAACDMDEALFRRVLPFAGIIRLDTFDYPVVITSGSVYVTQGSDRRSTGTHYTPRSLTEPIVQHALDPLVYTGPAEGLPPEEWKLHSAAEILDLKVCDMAMGSGAFLVQAIRYLSEKLVQAWELAGDDAAGLEEDLPADPAERLALARRLVSERCIYGVDKNPMATEMAKLSLWLFTMAKGHPFTFLDHALRAGDSLLGVNLRQLRAFSMDPDEPQGNFIEEPLRQALALAIDYRYRITHHPARDARENAQKEQLLAEADEIMAAAKLGADLLVAYALKGQGVPADLQYQYSVVLSAYLDSFRQKFSPAARELSRKAFRHLRDETDRLLRDPRFSNDPTRNRTPFHWPLEFPEVFAGNRPEPGFDALVGNPPFMGGQKITGALGTDYRDYLVEQIASGKRGSADYVAYFFLLANDIVKKRGDAALIATNTIAQGDTREVSLEQLVARGWVIPRAIPSQRWPGAAALEVAHIWLRNGSWESPFVLQEKPVSGITPFLTVPGAAEGKPFTLVANAGKSFQGSIVLGMGFVLEPEEALALIARNPHNKEVLFPYLNGEDLNSRHDQSPSRWVINFFDWPLEKAETYSDCMAIVREKVKPERDRNNRKERREKWWQYAEKAPALYSAIAGMERVLVRAQVSRTHAPVFFEPGIVFSMMTIVLLVETNAEYALIQSNLHENWVNEYSSSLKKDQRYTPSDCFENFPFPEETMMAGLEAIGEEYYRHRQQIMLTRQEGLTKTYNRFHNQAENSPDIVNLRELHRRMDEAVAAAYGWSDLALEHGFHQTKQGLRYTISEASRREVLGRLLKLNHLRHEEEVRAGLFEKGVKKGKKASRSSQPPLLKPADAPVSAPPARQQRQPERVNDHAHAARQEKLFEVEQPGSLWEMAGIAVESQPIRQSTTPSASKRQLQLVVENETAESDIRAWLGSVVTLREETAGAQDEQYILISDRESKEGVKQKKGYPALSIMTPLGMRLLDRKPGDSISYKGPGGQTLRFKVISVN